MTVELDSETREKWQRLLKEDALEASRYYFDNILDAVLDRLEGLPENATLRGSTVLLTSLMGMSPETTVISASLLRPEKLVVILSEAAMVYFDIAAEALIRRGVVRHSTLVHEIVDPTDPVDLYKRLRRHLPQGCSGMMDVTGGKKIMSATAAQVAWELQLKLCYIDGSYKTELRRPVPGTERLIVLASPSTQRVEQTRQHGIDLYDGGHFAEAAERFRQSRDSSDDNRFDVFALGVSEVYVAWADVDLNRLAERLDTLEELAQKERWRETLASWPNLSGHIAAYRKVTRGEPLGLLSSFLRLARLYHEQHRYDFACLLAYRAMEAIVEEGLSTWTQGKLDTGKPDYTLLGERAELESSFIKLSRSVGYGVESLPDKIGLVAGFGLLCIVDLALPGRVMQGASIKDVVGRARALAARRNESVLAHGTRTLTADDSRELREWAEKLAEAVLAERYDDLRRLDAALAPLSFRAGAR